MAFLPPPEDRVHNFLCPPPPKKKKADVFCSKGSCGDPIEDFRPLFPQLLVPGWLRERPAPSSSPNSLGLQDQERPLGERAEPHAVDANQALGDLPRGRASCREKRRRLQPQQQRELSASRRPPGPGQFPAGGRPPAWLRSGAAQPPGPGPTRV